MKSWLDDRVIKTLKDLETSNITLVEWEHPLLTRLGYPLVPKSDLIFLVPDEQLEKANDITASSGLQLVGDDDTPPTYLSEHAGRGFRYVYGDPKQRFILVPLSWTGIEKDELQIVPAEDGGLECTVWTAPLPSVCAAYLRIIVGETKSSRARHIAMADLAGVIGYSMFDMSYEGAYLALPEDDYDENGENTCDREAAAAKEAMALEKALEEVRGWRFSKDDAWTRDTLIQLISGQISYHQLPCKET
ncbi:hypothetical protein ACRALDRAFT_1053534 [Sodiomyces alcalophilus JCM 7366]|uniref:uncharacterized protein n=1 Tax=Sodiomyces alcalophilus JCM 7366 TaxID=591952 RepID=UPI0039B5B09E